MSLRARVMRGGMYLSVRQGIGMALSVGGVILLTRMIGPEAYGIFAAAMGIYLFLLTVSQWGVNVYLIRHEGELQPRDYHQAFSLLLLLGTSGMGLALLGLPLMERWLQIEGFGPVAIAMFANIPLSLILLVPLARMERELDYRRVVWIELIEQIAYYLVALILAYGGWGAWAPVGGWWARQFLGLVLVYGMSGYRPRLHWDSGLVQDMLGYGLGFSASNWVWQVRTLVNPFLVGRFAGAEAVGYVALAIRVVDVLGFVKSAAWRLSIAALGRLQGDRSRLTWAITEGMQLQILALGPFLVGFSVVAPWILPLLLGSDWLPMLEVYPFIALGYLVNAVFNMHSSALYVLRRNWEVTIFHVVHIALFAGGAFWLVPRVGLVGYGWAEVLALASYPVIHFFTVREVGSPDYRLAGLWMLAFALIPFWQELGWVAGVGAVLVILWPRSWKVLGNYARDFRKVQHG